MADKLTPEQVHLVTTHRVMAFTIAEDFWRRSNDNLDRKETISIAYQGLVTAALRFDPNWRPTVEDPENPAGPLIPDPNYQPFLAFGSFAKRRITGAILDWQRAQDHVPRRQRQTYKKLQAHGHGSGRSADELSELTGLAVEKIRAIVSAVESAAVSLDDNFEDKEEESHEHVESSVLVSSVGRLMSDAIASFPPVQRSIIVQRYYLGHDFPTIAVELGISVPTVRVMHQESMLILNSVFRTAASHT
ncbi:DNA binding protein [Microbacterium phage Magritte]|nr:DNA binding protein [Microbacterium phage Magritte]